MRDAAGEAMAEDAAVSLVFGIDIECCVHFVHYTFCRRLFVRRVILENGWMVIYSVLIFSLIVCLNFLIDLIISFSCLVASCANESCCLIKWLPRYNVSLSTQR